LHVVAAALADADGRVLIQRRAEDAHQGGLWEFPGGKLEPGEAREAGLRRELEEELGIHAGAMLPLIAVRHDYGDVNVRLDVWQVQDWRGEPVSREGQPLAWVAAEDLGRYTFPQADRPVLRALRLPSRCLVTPPPGLDAGRWLAALERAVAGGVQLVQLRAPGLHRARLENLAAAAVARCRLVAPQVRVLVNAEPSLALACGADGVHLDSRRLWGLPRRPLPASQLVGVSCHDAADLRRAVELDADFALLGPVAATTTHPGAVPLGWGTFAALCEGAGLPVYALGGMRPADAATARVHGGRGIAAIRGLWPEAGSGA
jgi:8-oxo-dGTP diphosphatase